MTTTEEYNMNYLLQTAATNNNVYVRIAAYQLALGRSRGDAMRLLIDTFDLTVEQSREIMLKVL